MRHGIHVAIAPITIYPGFDFLAFLMPWTTGPDA